jgi:two-component system chemotaxis response regulator CheY
MGKNVLVVDDSPTLLASVSFCLNNAGYQIYQAVNGKEGLEVLERLQGEEKKVALIITDINMPVMDGIQFIRKVKEGPYRFIPILVLTTESQEQLKQEGRDAGAAGWLLKPFRPEQLLWVVKKFIR